MNILPLIKIYENLINGVLSKNPYFYQLEDKINTIGDELTIDILREIIEFIDLSYKNSQERKDNYYVKKTMNRTLITEMGLLVFTKTYYQTKQADENGKYHCFSYIEEVLGLEKWAKMTLNAEVALINMATDVNMEYSSKKAIRNYEISRQTLSKKIRKLNVNQPDDIKRVSNSPSHLYIEMDEIHASLQTKRNKIVPIALIHEGYKEYFVNRKELKNKHYIGASILSYEQVWGEVYAYVDRKYDIDKIKFLFVSGDGASGIKSYTSVFPYAIYVLDKFHYRKALNYIFKRDKILTKIADDYLRNNRTEDLKLLVKIMIEKHPSQEKYMLEKQKYLLNNIEGIKNQKHKEYLCPCSMEGHISHKFASYITSRPFGFSEDGLENKIQLLIMKANGMKINQITYLKLKHEENYYKKIKLQKFKSKYKHMKNISNSNIEHLSLSYQIPILIGKNSGTKTLIESLTKDRDI